MVDVSEARKWILGLGRRILSVTSLPHFSRPHHLFEGITTLPHAQATLLPNSQFPSCCFILSSAIHHLILPVHVLSTTLSSTSCRSFDSQLYMT